MAEYNFLESLARIDDTLNSVLPNDFLSEIPKNIDINDNQVYNINATIVVVNFDCSRKSFLDTGRQNDLRMYQSFVSEAIVICRANPNCRDIIAKDKSLTLVYSTPMKADLNAVLDDVARVRSIGMIVSKKGNDKDFLDINVSIGIDYGRLSMLPVEHSLNGTRQYLWIGTPLENASKFATDTHYEIIISEIVWKNLSDKNRGMFSSTHSADNTYHSALINIMMNNWLTK